MHQLETYSEIFGAGVAFAFVLNPHIDKVDRAIIGIAAMIGVMTWFLFFA